MTYFKRYINKVVTVICLMLLAAAACACVFCARPALAEGTGVELFHLAPESNIVYCCFDKPETVFADSVGLLIPDGGITYSVSGESEITSKQNIPAQKVERHLEHNAHSEYTVALNNGGIYTYCGDAAPEQTDLGDYIVDFEIENDILYAVSDTKLYTVPLGDTSPNPAKVSATELVSSRGDIAGVCALTVCDKQVFVAAELSASVTQDICCVAADGRLSTVIPQANGVISLTSGDGYIYVLTRNELSRYTVSRNGWLTDGITVSGSELISAYEYGGYVYCLDNLKAVHKLSGDLSENNIILASAANATGFFNTPTGIAAKNSTLYVADKVNGRVAIYSDTVTYAPRSFYLPESVACDSAGNVYIAYSFNKVGIFPAGSFAVEAERTVTAPELGEIRQIAVDADKNLYILADNGLWVCGSEYDAVPSRLDATAYKAIALGVGRDSLYALADNKVVMFASGAGSVYCAAPSDGIALAVDLNGTAYVLTRTDITSYPRSGGALSRPLMLGGEPYTLGSDRASLMLCTVSNAFVEHGDLVIADTHKHRLLKADAKTALGATFIDGSYVKPDYAGSTAPAQREDGLIRKSLRAAGVYEYPMEAEPLFTLEAGLNVIVPVYSLPDAKEYSLVLVEDKELGRLVQGYVYRDVLSEPLPYDYKPSDSASVFNSGTRIYKYPSLYSPKAEGYSALPANQSFELLRFIRTYRDVNGYVWYRVALEGNCEGFVLSVNMSTVHYEPVFIRPAYNAKIISYKNSKFAPAYVVEGGKYVQVAELPTGTKVEVLDGFDSSQKYTHIKILDSERGTLKCYVETVYIEYEGVNVVLLVALLVIIITLILAAIIIGRMVYAKRKRLMHEDKETD